MKTKLLATIMLLSLMIGMLAFAMNIQPATAANAELKVTPPIVEKNPSDVNSFFDVFVDISVVNLFGFDINVTWGDNTLITLDQSLYNNTLDAIWGAGNWFLVMNVTGGGGGGGYYRLVALSTQNSFTGDHTLFQLHFKILRSCNFLLQTPIAIGAFKLSDKNWQIIPANVTNALFKINPTKPDLEYEIVDLTPSKPFEYCKIFEVKVYATHICANLKDYDFTFQFDNTLLKFVDVDEWGVLGNNVTGQAGYELVSPGTIHVWDLGGTTATGDSVYLFALTFHIEFNDDVNHIWRTNAPHELNATISLQNAELSFLEGTIPMSGITMPGPLTVTVHLIRGDVGPVDGTVTVFDLRTVANYYDQSSPVKYDLTMDGTIDIFDLVAVATNIGYPPP